MPSRDERGEPIFDRLRGWARTIKRDVAALYLAAGDPRVPWYAKAVAACVAASALSPIDLIPDSSRCWDISMMSSSYPLAFSSPFALSLPMSWPSFMTKPSGARPVRSVESV